MCYWYHHKQLNNHVCRSRTDWRHNDDDGDDNDDDVDDDGGGDYDDGDDDDDDDASVAAVQLIAHESTSGAKVTWRN